MREDPGPTEHLVTQPGHGRHATRRHQRTEVALTYSPTEAAQPHSEPQPHPEAQPHSEPQPHSEAQPYLGAQPYPEAQSHPEIRSYQETQSYPDTRSYREAQPYHAPPRSRRGTPSYQGAEPDEEQPPDEVIRYGPGVPAVPPGGQATQILWRASHKPAPPSGRHARLRQILGSALTVILLAASGVILYHRFHHVPFQVSAVVISRQTHMTCGVEVTGQINTNGVAGTISYLWLFRPGRGTPQPLSLSVAAGQDDVDVTVAIRGEGHGSASQAVTLQVLGPDLESASTGVVISC